MRLPQARALPVWRSMLFVPANLKHYYDKAVACDPDAIVLDLEDGVASDAKAAARAAVPEAAHTCASAGADILVRINRPIGLAVRDIEAVVSPAVSALMLPKVESAGHVRLLAELVDTCEAQQGMERGQTRFYVVVESVQAFPHMFEIAAAHPRLVAFTCGTEDFTASTGSQPDPDVLLYPKQQGIFAARAAGILPLGILASGANYRDLEGLRAAVQTSRRFGVEGSSCIHPAQVPILNEGFTPGEAEIAKAQRIVDASDAGLRQGRGAVGLQDSMIDAPVVERARRVLAIAARCAEQSQRRAR